MSYDACRSEFMRPWRVSKPMISSIVWQRRGVPRRVLWSLLASMAINVFLWMTVYPHLSFPREVPRKKVSVASVRIEHRIVPRPHARKRPQLLPRPQAQTKPQLHARNAQRLPRPFPHSHSRKKPRQPVPLEAHRKPPESRWSGHLSFTPHQSAALRLPASWATQDNGNAAAANMTVWMDFKKARGAFVPQVMLWHVNAAFLSGPSLHDAVADIVGSLRAEGAKVYVSKAQRVCGGKRLGWFLAYEKPNTDPPWQFEDTLYMAGDTVYRATYSRPDGLAEDKNTRAALDSLCPAP